MACVWSSAPPTCFLTSPASGDHIFSRPATALGTGPTAGPVELSPLSDLQVSEHGGCAVAVAQPPTCLDFFVHLGHALAAPGSLHGYNSPNHCACRRADSRAGPHPGLISPCAPAALIVQALQQAHPVFHLQLRQKARYLFCSHYLQTLLRSFLSRATPAEANRGWY